MGRRSETGGVSPAGDRIQVRFTWKGEDLRPTLPLKPNAANLAHAKRLRRDILEEIRDGTFQLAKYFPDYKFASKHEQPHEAGQRTFGEWCKLWKQLSARSLEHSTLDIYWRHLRAYWLAEWSDLAPAQITHEMVLQRLADLAQDRLDETTGKVVKGIGRKTQNNIMIPLRGVFELICRPPSTATNPTEGIDNLKVQKPAPDPFAPDEVEVVLAKLRSTEGDEMADWFEFAFFAGLRSSEQLALSWREVDLRAMTVLIRKARVLTQEKDRTKTHAERLVELNARAAAVLERQRARTQLQSHGKVFATAGQPGKAWHDEQVQWRAWQRAMRLSGVRYRPPKECRDTSVTMALQAGADVVWVANQHGHSVQVMMRDYARWIPKADRGRNLALLNAALTGGEQVDSAVKAQ